MGDSFEIVLRPEWVDKSLFGVKGIPKEAADAWIKSIKEKSNEVTKCKKKNSE